MRIRILAAAAAALVGFAGSALAQVPVAPPTGLTPVPPPALPAPAPIVVPAQPGCGTPAPAACDTPASTGGCSTCGKPKAARSGVLGKFLIAPGTAMPITCGCLAAEKTLMFGGCGSFFAPRKTCDGTPIEYGPGGMEKKDNCKSITSFLNK